MEKERTLHVEGSDLGGFLKNIRLSRGLTLRQVEAMTDKAVSNGYLSQLENGNIDKPSAVMLHRIATAFGLEYQDVMRRAGIATDADQPVNRVGTSILGELSSEEEDQLLAFLGYLRSQRK